MELKNKENEMNNSFLTREELESKGFKNLGDNVKISRYANFYNPGHISLGNNVRIDDFCILSGEITIGSYVHISAYCALYGSYGISIDDFSGLSPRTIIHSASDDFSGNFLIGPTIPSEYTNVKGGIVIIERFVQIGSGSVILPGVNIKEGSVAGAMSLVTKDMEKWGIYAGIPVTRIKERQRDLIKYVKQLISQNGY